MIRRLMTALSWQRQRNDCALLSKVAPDAAAALKPVKLASSAVVGLKFDSDAGLPDNSGVLIAADQPGVHAKAYL